MDQTETARVFVLSQAVGSGSSTMILATSEFDRALQEAETHLAQLQRTWVNDSWQETRGVSKRFALTVNAVAETRAVVEYTIQPLPLVP